jgi:methionyl-tRNA formyltransferase
LRLVIDRVEVASDATEKNLWASGGRQPPGDVVPGQILADNENRLFVATGTAPLSLLTLQPSGKRHMSAAEFLRGYQLREGEMLGTVPNIPSAGG